MRFSKLTSLDLHFMGKVEVAYEWDHGTVVIHSITSDCGGIRWHLPQNAVWWGTLEGMIESNWIDDCNNDQSDFYNDY